jgi:uncharacterized protein (DUF2384 family)
LTPDGFWSKVVAYFFLENALRAKAARAVAKPGPRQQPSAAAVLTKAVVRAARLLSFSQRELAHILGVSEATASRLCAGSYQLSATRTKEWELGLLLVRLFRSLDALWGHEEAAHTWLKSDNLALAARPVDLVSSIEGLVRVVNYLDNARGRL